MRDRKIEDRTKTNGQHDMKDHKAMIRRMKDAIVNGPGKNQGKNPFKNRDPADFGTLIIRFLEGIAQALNVEFWCPHEGRFPA